MIVFTVFVITIITCKKYCCIKNPNPLRVGRCNLQIIPHKLFTGYYESTKITHLISKITKKQFLTNEH